MSNADRIHSLDAFRTISIFFVITLHTHPFLGMGLLGNVSNFVIDGVARFAVPLFFVISGYLFSMKLSGSSAPTDYAVGYLRKIAGVYLFGTVLFVFGFTLVRSWIQGVIGSSEPVESVVLMVTTFGAGISAFGSQIVANPGEFVYYGTAVNGKLWFLTALGIAIGLVYLFYVLGREQYLLPTAAGVHILGLFGQTYYFLFGLGGSPFPTRDALFFGFFYVSLGYAIHRSDRAFSDHDAWRYLGLFGVFTLLHLAERYVLGYVVLGNDITRSVYTTNYQVTTVVMVLSLFLFALSNPRMGEGTRTAALGKYALGIYLVHPVLMRVDGMVFSLLRLSGPAYVPGVVWELIYTPAVFLVSLAIYVWLGRSGVVDVFYSSGFNPRQDASS